MVRENWYYRYMWSVIGEAFFFAFPRLGVTFCRWTCRAIPPLQNIFLTFISIVTTLRVFRPPRCQRETNFSVTLRIMRIRISDTTRYSVSHFAFWAFCPAASTRSIFIMYMTLFKIILYSSSFSLSLPIRLSTAIIGLVVHLAGVWVIFHVLRFWQLPSPKSSSWDSRLEGLLKLPTNLQIGR